MNLLKDEKGMAKTFFTIVIFVVMFIVSATVILPLLKPFLAHVGIGVFEFMDIFNPLSGHFLDVRGLGIMLLISTVMAAVITGIVAAFLSMGSGRRH